MTKPSTSNLIRVVVVVVAILLIAGLAYTIGRNNTPRHQETEPGAQTEQGSPAVDVNDQDDATDTNTTTPTVDSGGEISASEAEQTTLDEFGGTIDEIERDTYNGTPTWKIEVADSREGNIKVEIDRQTGEIIHWERD